MKTADRSLSVRWMYLVTGVVAMLFAGVLYAWSILKSPLAAEFGLGASALSTLNFYSANSYLAGSKLTFWGVK